ncbi:hypothetical protein C2857_005201 [Epichloe festucae Fl1]|uniref:Cell wall protein n=1 Tax=Epichloe festucae (strain Fl1) TaxID=877507 RepID=A0A7U3Q2G1_EPIFF|nr:hypothetical protein C2857_005201 [Epichloe festucae Fl1]
MKFLTALTTILVAPGALSLAVSILSPRSLRSSSSIAQRDISAATSVLASVKSGFGSLSDAARVFNGDAEPFKKAASGLLSTVESGTAAFTKMNVPVDVGLPFLAVSCKGALEAGEGPERPAESKEGHHLAVQTMRNDLRILVSKC